MTIVKTDKNGILQLYCFILLFIYYIITVVIIIIIIIITIIIIVIIIIMGDFNIDLKIKGFGSTNLISFATCLI